VAVRVGMRGTSDSGRRARTNVSGVTDLSSAPVPAVGSDDHVRGQGADAILYFDLACPHCAAAWRRVRALPLRLCFRHFPVASKHARAPVLHAAAEAAAQQRQDAFFEFCDSLYADHGHQDDPHLWERALELELELDRFERDRRSEAVAERVRRDFQGGIRAGITGTPAAFLDGQLVARNVPETLAAAVAEPA
jgi:protein-disulfide isomerase